MLADVEERTPALEVRCLRKAFPGPGPGRLVVDVPTLCVGAGQQLALQGDSGSGKTTLLHLIAGILEADAGTILVAGRDMAALREAQRDRLRAATIGYVFQSFNLLQGHSALENVLLAMAFAGGMDEARARDLLTKVGLAGSERMRPAQLSAGQQQRVAIARALANRPRLVLADEPTANLDRANAARCLALMREVCGTAGAALLVVSHDPHVLAGFDDVQDVTQLNRAAPPPLVVGRELRALVASQG